VGTGVRSTSSNRLPESGSITGSNNKRSPFPVRFTICKAGTAVGLAPDQAVAADTLTPTKIDISVRIVLEAATTHAEARRAMRIWSGRRKRCVNVTWFAVRKPENSGNRRKRSCCLREPTPRVSIVSCLAAFRAVAACRCICESRCSNIKCEQFNCNKPEQQHPNCYRVRFKPNMHDLPRIHPQKVDCPISLELVLNKQKILR